MNWLVNLILQLKDQELICEEEEDDPEDLYNVPAQNNVSSLAQNNLL